MPGNPTIVVQNIGGGGSVKGVNQFAARAKPDGMMISAIGTGTFFKYILDDSSVKYDLPTFIPFLNSPFGVVVYARTDLGVKGPEEIKKLQAMTPVYGGDGALAGDLPALLSLDLLGIKLKTVFGLSNSKSRQAFARGEVNINYDNVMGAKMFVLPANTPADIVATYNEAMAKVIASPEFNSKQGKKILGGYAQSTDQRAVKTLQSAAVLGATEKAWLKAWLKKTHGVGA